MNRPACAADSPLRQRPIGGICARSKCGRHPPRLHGSRSRRTIHQIRIQLGFGGASPGRAPTTCDDWRLDLPLWKRSVLETIARYPPGVEIGRGLNAPGELHAGRRRPWREIARPGHDHRGEATTRNAAIRARSNASARRSRTSAPTAAAEIDGRASRGHRGADSSGKLRSTRRAASPSATLSCTSWTAVKRTARHQLDRCTFRADA